MSNLTYSYNVANYDAGTQIATTVYTPSIDTLPTITLPVAIAPGMTDQQKHVAISQLAPFPTWWEIDPSTRPPSTPGVWQVFPNPS